MLQIKDSCSAGQGSSWLSCLCSGIIKLHASKTHAHNGCCGNGLSNRHIFPFLEACSQVTCGAAQEYGSRIAGVGGARPQGLLQELSRLQV